MKLFDDPQQEITVWEVRESGLGATAWIPGHPPSWPGWEDSAVPAERVGNYLRDLHQLFDRYQYECALYGHIGQGCVHCRVDFDLFTDEGIKKYRSFISEAADLRLKGSGANRGSVRCCAMPPANLAKLRSTGVWVTKLAKPGACDASCAHQNIRPIE
jgi:FAD linked oxidases, C-terminal domain